MTCNSCKGFEIKIGEFNNLNLLSEQNSTIDSKSQQIVKIVQDALKKIKYEKIVDDDLIHLVQKISESLVNKQGVKAGLNAARPRLEKSIKSISNSKVLGEEIGKQLLALRKNKVSKALAPNLVASLQVVQDLNTAQTLLSLILQNTYEVQLPIIANRIVEDVATVNLASKLKSLSKKSVKKKIKKIGKVKITKKAGIDLIRDPVTGEMRPPRRSDFDASNVSPQDGSDQRQLQEVRIKIFENKSQLREIGPGTAGLPMKMDPASRKAMSSILSKHGGTVGHTALDIIGFVDPFGLADGINAAWYAAEGKPVMSLISVIGAIIPYFGDAVKLLKIIKVSKNTGLPIKRLVSETMKHSGDIIKALEKIGQNSPKMLEIANEIKRLQNQPIAKAVAYFTKLFGRLGDDAVGVGVQTSVKAKVAAKEIQIATKSGGKAITRSALKRFYDYKVRGLTASTITIQAAIGVYLSYTDQGQKLMSSLVGLPADVVVSVMSIFDKPTLQEMQKAAYSEDLDGYPLIRELILNILSSAIQAKSNIGGVKFSVKESNESEILSEASKEFANYLSNQFLRLMKFKGNAQQFTKKLTQLKARANKVAKATDPEIKASDKLSYFKNAIEAITTNIDSLKTELGFANRRLKELPREIKALKDDIVDEETMALTGTPIAELKEKLAKKQAAKKQIEARKKLIESQIKDLEEAKATFERAIPPLESAAEAEAKVAAKPKPKEPKVKPDEIDIPKKSGKRIVGEALGSYYASNLACRVIGGFTVYAAVAFMTKNPTIKAMIKSVYENAGSLLLGGGTITATLAALLVKHKGDPLAAYSELLKKYGPVLGGGAFGCASGFRAGFGQEFQETTWDRTNATKEWNELQARVVKATPKLTPNDLKAAEFVRSPQFGDVPKLVKQGKYWDGTKSGFKQLVGVPVVNFAQYMGGAISGMDIQEINELFSDIYDVKNYEGTIAEQIKTATYVDNIPIQSIGKFVGAGVDAFFGNEKTIAEEMVEKYANLKTLERVFNELVRRTIPPQTLKGFSNIIVFFESQGVPQEDIMHLIDCLFTKEFAESIEQYEDTRKAIKEAYGFDLPPAEISAIIKELIKAKEKITKSASYKKLKETDPRKVALKKVFGYIPDEPKADCKKLMKENETRLNTIYEVLFPKSKNKPKPQPAAPPKKPELKYSKDPDRGLGGKKGKYDD